MTKEDHPKWDPLKEFHLHKPECRIYALLDEVTDCLDKLQNNVFTADEASNRLSQILGHNESNRLLRLICERTDTDFDSLLESLNTTNFDKYKLPRLLLLLIMNMDCYHDVTYIANKLHIDVFWAQQLLEHLYHTFSIDSPLLWLQGLLTLTIKEREYCQIEYDDMRLGVDINEKKMLRDTAEARKYKIEQQKSVSIFHRLVNILRPKGS